MIYRIKVILNRNPALTGKLGEIVVVSREIFSDNREFVHLTSSMIWDFEHDYTYNISFR